MWGTKCTMKFHTYLGEVLGSGVKVKLLRLLVRFPDKGFGLRELAALLEIDHRSVSKAIKEFDQHNLVVKRVFGRSYALSLNAESYLYPPLKALFQREEATLSQLIRLIKQHLSPTDVQLCALFGSVAEKEETYNSDIDLLIITPRKKKALQKIEPLRLPILHLFGNPLSPLLFTPQEFAATNPRLRENILKNNLLIYGKWENLVNAKNGKH